MLVAVFFVQPDGRTPQIPLYHIYGKYNICGFVFVGNSDVQAFCTRAGKVYTRIQCSHRQQLRNTVFIDQEGCTDVLMLSIDQEET